MRAILVTILMLATSACFITPGGTNDPIACTDLYTEGGLAIRIVAPASDQPVEYAITVATGGETLSIGYSLSSGAGAVCSQPCGTTGDRFVIDQGLAPQGGSEMLAFVTDSSRTKGPVTAQIKIVRMGVTLYDQEAHPVYRTTEPNGRGCGQVSNADISVTVQ